jgi:hypothetical protein
LNHLTQTSLADLTLGRSNNGNVLKIKISPITVIAIRSGMMGNLGNLGNLEYRFIVADGHHIQDNCDLNQLETFTFTKNRDRLRDLLKGQAADWSTSREFLYIRYKPDSGLLQFHDFNYLKKKGVEGNATTNFLRTLLTLIAPTSLTNQPFIQFNNKLTNFNEGEFTGNEHHIPVMGGLTHKNGNRRRRSRRLGRKRKRGGAEARRRIRRTRRRREGGGGDGSGSGSAPTLSRPPLRRPLPLIEGGTSPPPSRRSRRHRRTVRGGSKTKTKTRSRRHDRRHRRRPVARLTSKL